MRASPELEQRSHRVGQLAAEDAHLTFIGPIRRFRYREPHRPLIGDERAIQGTAQPLKVVRPVAEDGLSLKQSQH